MAANQPMFFHLPIKLKNTLLVTLIKPIAYWEPREVPDIRTEMKTQL